MRLGDALPFGLALHALGSRHSLRFFLCVLKGFCSSSIDSLIVLHLEHFPLPLAVEEARFQVKFTREGMLRKRSVCHRQQSTTLDSGASGEGGVEAVRRLASVWNFTGECL